MILEVSKPFSDHLPDDPNSSKFFKNVVDPDGLTRSDVKERFAYFLNFSNSQLRPQGQLPVIALRLSKKIDIPLSNCGGCFVSREEQLAKRIRRESSCYSFWGRN